MAWGLGQRRPGARVNAGPALQVQRDYLYCWRCNFLFFSPNNNNAMATATFPDDCLPPEAVYESQDALFRSINAWAAARGYAFTRRRSTKEKSGKTTVTYGCDRRRTPSSTTRQQQRRSTTRGTSCLVSVIAKELFDNTWVVKYCPDQRFSQYNYELSQDPSAYPVYCQLLGSLLQLAELSDADIALKEIQTIVRGTGSLATRQDINNRIAEHHRDSYMGQSPIHALINNLSADGFWSQIQHAPDGRVTAILFAHSKSLAYLQSYPEVLLLDCTYKTNKYGMPLLDMIGVNATQRSFCIAFAFLSSETEANYI